MIDEDQLRSSARTILRRYGPLPVAELTRHLVEAAATDPGTSPDEVWSILLTELDEDDGPATFTAYPLPDGQLCDLDHLVDGLTLTHVLTDDERDSGEVPIEPDLLPIVMLGTDDREVVLAGGGTLDLGWDEVAGPPGWLPDEPVLVVTFGLDGVTISGAADVPPVDGTTVDRLAATHDAYDGQVEAVELVLAARARHPLLLDHPQAPLGELLASADLYPDESGWLVQADELHDPDHGLDLDDHLDLGGELRAHVANDHGVPWELAEQLVAASGVVHDLAAQVVEEVVLPFVDDLQEALADDLGDAADAKGRIVGLVADAVRTTEVSDDVVAVLAHERATLAWAHDVIAGDELVALVTSVLLHHVIDHLPRLARAGHAWLSGHVAELLGDDLATAEREYRQALMQSPSHAEATWDLARCKSIRGDAGAALGLLGQLRDSGGDTEWLEVLQRHAAPGPTSAGRNDPCPCGSGRKHKVCCAPRNGWPLADRFRWMQLKLIQFAVSPAAAGIIEDAMGPDLGLHEVMPDVVGRSALYHEGGLIAAFADRAASLLPADELELYRAWADVTVGAHLVVEVDPGRGLVLLDQRTGDRVEVADVSLSRSLAVDDLVMAWMLPTARGAEPSGGVVPVPEHARTALLELVDGEPTPEQIIQFDDSLHAPPRLANREGDALVLCTTTWEVDDPAAAGEALAGELERHDDHELVALIDIDGDDVLAGTVRLGDGTVVAETNSVERAVRLAEVVERLVPSAVRVDESREPFAAAAAGRGDVAGGRQVPEMTPELVEALDQMMAQMEDRWVDEPVPALDGMTPREAVADPTRRGDVERLLRSFEPRSSRSGPGRPMDPDRLRLLLGLDG